MQYGTTCTRSGRDYRGPLDGPAVNLTPVFEMHLLRRLALAMRGAKLQGVLVTKAQFRIR